MTAEPRYNIRAVERLTGVPAPTLRSWERRYGFPLPVRTATARRLYSEDDLRVIRWVRCQTGLGLAVAQAIDLAREGASVPPHHNSAGGPLPDSETLVAALVGTARHYDEHAVEAALALAFSTYPPDRVLLEVLTPALVTIGDLWAGGELSATAEHFITNLIRRRLLALLGSQPVLAQRPAAVLACLPGEQHELGLLMLALFLRWSGLHVIYLGANVPVSDLIHLLETEDLDALCLSGGVEADWAALTALDTALKARPRPLPVFIGGGGATDRSLPTAVTVTGADLRAAAATITARITTPENRAPSDAVEGPVPAVET